MPKSTFDAKAESTAFELLPKGNYPYEVIACDFELSKGPKTRGSDVMVLKLAFYRDDKFEKKAAQWSEDFIFHPSCDWRLSVFAKSANMLVNGTQPADGAEIDWTPELVIGLRGWATVGTRTHGEDKAKAEDEKRKYNEVVVWLTNLPKLSRVEAKAKPEDEGEPF